MKCKDCNVWGCQHRTSNAEQECVLQNIAGDIITQHSEGTKAFLVPKGSAMTIDWQAFRREAAKDILCSMVSGGHGIGWESEQASHAIKFADELIKLLKQE